MALCGGIRGKAASLPGLPLQFADYAFWQRQYMQGDVLENRWVTGSRNWTALRRYNAC